MQMGGVYTTSASHQEEGIPLQKHRGRNGRCIVILFTGLGVRDRCDSPKGSDTYSECKLSNGWSRSYRVMKLLVSGGE